VLQEQARLWPGQIADLKRKACGLKGLAMGAGGLGIVIGSSPRFSSGAAGCWLWELALPGIL